VEVKFCVPSHHRFSFSNSSVLKACKLRYLIMVKINLSSAERSRLSAPLFAQGSHKIVWHKVECQCVSFIFLAARLEDRLSIASSAFLHQSTSSLQSLLNHLNHNEEERERREIKMKQFSLLLLALYFSSSASHVHVCTK